MRFYPRGGIKHKATDIITKESFIFFLSNVLKLYFVVSMWLQYQVGPIKQCITTMLVNESI